MNFKMNVPKDISDDDSIILAEISLSIIEEDGIKSLIEAYEKDDPQRVERIKELYATYRIWLDDYADNEVIECIASDIYRRANGTVKET